MKYMWEAERLFRKLGGPGVHSWRQEKAAEFQKETGVAWSSYSMAGMIVFRPHYDPAVNQPREAKASKLLPFLPVTGIGDNISLLQLAARAEVTLQEAVEGTAWLAKEGRLWFDVDRSGSRSFPKLFASEKFKVGAGKSEVS